VEAIGGGDVEAVLVSLGAGDRGGAGLIAAIAGRWPDLPVVAVTEPGGRAQGFAARAAGAWDYLEPPADLAPERLVTVIAGALERRRLRRDLRAAHAAAPETLNLEARERQAILAALEATRWNKQAAARLLGLHRPTLYAKMRKHGIPQARPH
jgi:DNA-binding NtrC family response regulator